MIGTNVRPMLLNIYDLAWISEGQPVTRQWYVRRFKKNDRHWLRLKASMREWKISYTEIPGGGEDALASTTIVGREAIAQLELLFRMLDELQSEHAKKRRERERKRSYRKYTKARGREVSRAIKNLRCLRPEGDGLLAA